MKKTILSLVLFAQTTALASTVPWETIVRSTPTGSHPAITTKSFNIDYYTGSSMMLGRGYDSFKDDSSGKCVTIPASEYDSNRQPNTIQESVFKMELVESKHDLATKLSVSAAASLKSGFSKASATVNYLNEQTLNQYSIYILVSAEVLTPIERAKDEDLDTNYIDYARSNADAFRIKCGNEYVAAIQRGGVFYGLLRLDTEDSTSYSQIKASLRARVGTFKAAADMERSISEAISHKSLQIFSFQIGGESKPFPTNVSELVERVRNFPDEIARLPIPLRVITAPYAQLKSYPIAATPFDTSTQEGVLDYLSQLRFKLTDQRNDTGYILSNKSQFKSFSADELNARVDYLNGKLNDINVLTKQCMNNFTNCKYPSDFQYKEIVLPERLERAQADNQCKPRLREECGFIYKTAADQFCKPKTYKLGKAEVCGVKKYKTARSAACPVETYKQSSGAECGVQAYNQRSNGAICGWDIAGECTRFAPITVSPFRGSSCYSKPQTCRNPAFGVESYNSCRHSNFGIEAYSECADPSHGVGEYNECHDAQFGVEEYESCQHINHGIEGVRQCNLLEYSDSENGTIKYKECTP